MSRLKNEIPCSDTLCTMIRGGGDFPIKSDEAWKRLLQASTYYLLVFLLIALFQKLDECDAFPFTRLENREF